MKPLEKINPIFSRKTNFSKSVNTSKDVKGKNKVVTEPEISLEEFEANLKKEKKAFAKKMDEKHKDFIQRKTIPVDVNLCDNKMKVFKIFRGENSVLLKRTFWVDMNINFHVYKKTSLGPKKVWVPKSL